MFVNSKVYLCFATFLVATISESVTTFPPQAPTTAAPQLKFAFSKLDAPLSPEHEDQEIFLNINSYEIVLDAFISTVYRKLNYIEVLNKHLNDKISKSTTNLMERLDSYRIRKQDCRRGYCENTGSLNALDSKCEKFIPDKDQYKTTIELLEKAMAEKIINNKFILISNLNFLILNYNITKSNYLMNMTDCLYKKDANECNVSNDNWLKETIRYLNKEKDNIRSLTRSLFELLQLTANNIKQLEITIFTDIDNRLKSLSCCINQFNFTIPGIDCEPAENIENISPLE